MSATLSYILRNCTMWADNESKLGQMSEVGIALPSEKNESFRNAGMVRERKVPLGIETPDFEFMMTAFDPQALKLLMQNSGSDHPYMVTGALQDEDGTVHQAIYTMRGRMSEVDAGKWKPGQKSETTYKVIQNYAKLEIDGELIFEWDDFSFAPGGGTGQSDAIRSALLI